jgi:hypothetical protein
MCPRIPRRHREGEEVSIQILETRAVRMSSEEGGRAEQLPRAGDLDETIPPPRIREGQIKQLERPVESASHETRVAVPPADHSPHLTPNVGELLGE